MPKAQQCLRWQELRNSDRLRQSKMAMARIGEQELRNSRLRQSKMAMARIFFKKPKKILAIAT